MTLFRLGRTHKLRPNEQTWLDEAVLIGVWLHVDQIYSSRSTYACVAASLPQSLLAIPRLTHSMILADGYGYRSLRTILAAASGLLTKRTICRMQTYPYTNLSFWSLEFGHASVTVQARSEAPM